MACEVIHDRPLCRHRRCLHRLAVCIELVAPRFPVVRARLFIVAGEDARIEIKVVAQEAEGVRVAAQIVGIVFLVLNNIIDKCSEECDICAGTKLEEMIRDARRAGKADIDMDDDGSVVLCLHNVLHRHRMALRHVRAFDPDQLRVLEVVPRAGHCTAPECAAERRWGRRMADARLVVDEYDTERARHLDQLVALLVVDLRAADKADGIRTVAHELLTIDLIFADPVLVTRLLHGTCCAVDRLLPADLLPVVTAGRTVHRALRSLRRVRNVPVANPLRAETAAIDGGIRRTFEVDQLAVLDVADRATAAAAEVADGGKFATARQLVLFRRRLDFADVQTETCKCQPDAA